MKLKVILNWFTMDREKKKDLRMVAVTAYMEGEAVVVRNIGRMRKVSEMELVVLCNLAHLACLQEFSMIDDEIGDKAEIEADEVRNNLRQRFANKINNNGLHRLMQSCVAMLGEKRLGQYVW